MLRKCKRFIKSIYYYIIANTLGRIFYQKKYMRGKNFSNIYSIGWEWIVKSIWFQKIHGYNRHIKFPVSFRSIVSTNNIEFDPDDLGNFQHFGCYFQNFNGKIVLGKGTYIAPNVGIITANHDLQDLNKHQEGKDVIIGEKCWIGMNCMILPGVKLGNNTIVGAGSIVTKSFEQGNCIIVGNPAKIIKYIGEENE